jgi:predicted AAA+ superfamily ATPase
MARARLAAARLASLARRFPAVGILGPRQIGKSTIARLAFPDWARLDLEDPRDETRLRADPRFVLEQHLQVVIDEAQRMPELFPVLRVHLDENPRRRVVLLGSASPVLARGLSESLTGRIALFELGPVSLLEHDADKLWLLGGFPRLHWARPRPDPETFFASYLTTALEQDLPLLGLRFPASRLRALLTMIASAQGGLCNLSELGGSLGVSYHHVSDLVDALEGVFLVRRLRPYFVNVGKRLVKAPKLYVRDTGLLHSLLGLRFDRRALLAHAKAGPSFETFCIEQILSLARMADPASEAFFWRTHAGAEVDLLLRLRGEIVPIEIKLGRVIPDLRGLRACMSDLGLSRAFVLSSTPEPVALERNVRMLNLATLAKELRIVPAHPRQSRNTVPQ